MKVGIIGANGKAGSLIAKEALERGLDVTAIVRNSNKVSGLPVIEKDIMSLTYEDLKGFDVVTYRLPAPPTTNKRILLPSKISHKCFNVN